MTSDKGIRRQKEKESRFSVSDDNEMDHDTHNLFCQMNILSEEGTTWKETARYELHLKMIRV